MGEGRYEGVNVVVVLLVVSEFGFRRVVFIFIGACGGGSGFEFV